tara:strand:+ start:1139 stop:1906 length:768 start_codon:yes stop_codon:yes gene_type:complete
MDFTENDLNFFLKLYNENLYVPGSMCSVDMFSLHFALKQIKPKVVIESGVWHGASTELIRKTVGKDVTIISIDPMEIPPTGWKDTNCNTIYYTGKNFVDFKNINLDNYNPEEIFAYFDDHQNMVSRIIQCRNKNIRHLLFNDNYPKNCGSHFTFEHLLNDDFRNINTDARQIINVNKNDNFFKNYNENKKNLLSTTIKKYHIFPNIYKTKIKTGEGLFDCKYKYDEMNDGKNNFNIFKKHAVSYRWNTYIEIETV